MQFIGEPWTWLIWQTFQLEFFMKTNCWRSSVPGTFTSAPPGISLIILVIFQLNMRKQQLEGAEIDWISKGLLNGFKLRQFDLFGVFFVSLFTLVPHRHQEAAGREPGGDRGHGDAAGVPAQAHGWDQTPGGETQVQGSSCHQNLQDSYSPCQIQLRGLAGR